MPYKIVQTLEGGHSRLVIVPSFWEVKGKLWWPPKKVLDKVIKDDQAKPNKEWKSMNCVLKRKNIPTYQQADTELTIMEQNLDSDGEEGEADENQPREDVVLKFENHEEVYLAEGQSTLNHYGNVTTTENMLQLNSADHLSNFDQILTNQKILSEKIDHMLEIQNNTIEYQKRINQKLTNLSARVEEISEQLIELRENPTSVTMEYEELKDKDSFSLKAIESESDLIELDKILGDDAHNSRLQKQLSFLCSASEGGGVTCAYKLLDIIFTRDFLCLCSWSGGSRTDQAKVALKHYKNVMNFFFTIIHSWDSTYTVEENEKFFKVVTRNSLKRKFSKNLRASTKRHRKSKIAKRQKTDNEKQPNNQNIDTEGDNSNTRTSNQD